MSEVECSIPASSKFVHFSWSSVKIPEYSAERHSHPHSQRFNGVRLPLPAIFSQLGKARDTAFGFLGSLLHQQRNSTTMSRRMATPLLCCASISSAGNGENKGPFLEPENLQTESKEREAANEFTNGGGDWEGPAFEEAEGSQQLQKHACGCRQMKEEEERVLISEVLFQNKDGEELEDVELRNSAMGALKVCKPNSALTVQEVQEDCYRIFQSGYFWSISPVTVDTRDGVRLIFQVEPNQEFRGLICEGANVLPAKIVEDAFKDEYGKIVNIQQLIKVLNSINSWYRERGFLAEVSLGGVEMLSGGIIRLQASEAEVNNITIRFLDKKTGEPTVGKTRPETLLRQLTTKRGQVYSLQQVKRDIETLLTMGIMEDANIIPHPVGDTGKVDLTMNVVERTTSGFTAGGGISGSGMPGGLLSSLVGSFAYSHNNVFGRNQKLNVSLERGQIDSAFRINYTDPWIDGDDKRTSRSITLQNSRTPGTLVHGPKSPGASQSVTIGRLMAGLDYNRPLRPKWSGTAGLSFQRAGAREDNGNPVLRDDFQAPYTFTGKDHDDMLLSKLETVYADSGDRGSSMLVFNMEQGLPVYPEWLIFNRVNLRARHGMQIGHYRCIVSFSGGKVIGDLAPHEAFAIGGTNSVRGYEEGAVGSGRSFFVASGEISVPMYGPVAGAIFADYGTDFGSGQTVPGDPAGARSKPGSGYGYGAGIRVDTPLGPLRLEYAYNNLQTGRFHFGVGYRN